MKLTFIYDPSREIIPLKFGFRSTNSAVLTEFARRAQADNIEITDVDKVEALSLTLLREASLDSAIVRDSFQEKWETIESEVVARFQKMFQTDWEPGDVTAYLTVSTRCPYNASAQFFFVSFFKTSPMRTCLHELQHFYAHQLLEPIFTEQNKAERFNEFKESLTVLLNKAFGDILESPDEGYEQHIASRKRILELFEQGQILREIATNW